MTEALRDRAVTLGIHPFCRGFGWIAFEGPFTASDWGLIWASNTQDKNLRCLGRFERLLDRLEPETVVLEVTASKHRRANRMTDLYLAMSAAASARGIDVATYPRSAIQTCFATVGARTRYEIAEAVARYIDALRHRLPKKRKAWHAEHRQMALFSAAALVLTHYHFGASEFFEGLKDAA